MQYTHSKKSFQLSIVLLPILCFLWFRLLLKVLNSGIPEGTAATTSLPDDAWDLLGLAAADGLNDRELHIKNGQVCLLTGGRWSKWANSAVSMGNPPKMLGIYNGKAH